MTVRTWFVFFNYTLALLALLCLFYAEVFPPAVGLTLVAGLAVLVWLEARGRIPVEPPARFSLFKLSLVLLPLLYLVFHPEIPQLLSGFLVFALYTRFLFKTELNDYLYGHLIALVCLLIGALFIQDLAFAFLFLGFYLILCWALIFYTLMVERLGSRCPPDGFRPAGRGVHPESALFGWTGLMMLFSLALTAVIFMAFPRLGLGFFGLEQGGTPISGFSDRVTLGDVGRIKQNQDVVMRVQYFQNGRPLRPRGKILWRGVVLDHYDGRTWTATLPIIWNAEHRPGRPLELFHVNPPEDIVRQEIYTENIDTPVVFTHGLPLRLDGNFKSLNLDAGFALRLADQHQGPRRFEILADIGQGRKGFALPLAGDLSPETRRRLLQVPPLSRRIRELARKLSASGPSPLDRAEATLRFFQSGFAYSLNMERSSQLPAIDEFLFVRKAGHCEYFASAMVLLLRLQGIPARMINGFSGVEWNEMGDYLIIRQSHAHSWVEAFFPGRGWKVFDPTPSDPGAASHSLNRLGLYFDLMRLYWQRYVVKYSLGDQVRLLQFFSRQTRSLKEGWRSWTAFKPENLWTALRGQGPLTWILVLALGGLVWLTRRWWWPGGPARPPLPFAAVQYRKLLRRLEQRGLVKAPGWTAREFLRHLESLPPEEQEAVARATDLYEKSRFGGLPLSGPEQRALKGLVHRVAPR